MSPGWLGVCNGHSDNGNNTNDDDDNSDGDSNNNQVDVCSVVS